MNGACCYLDAALDPPGHFLAGSGIRSHCHHRSWVKELGHPSGTDEVPKDVACYNLDTDQLPTEDTEFNQFTLALSIYNLMGMLVLEAMKDP